MGKISGNSFRYCLSFYLIQTDRNRPFSDMAPDHWCLSLRLIEKASSYRQMMEHRKVNNTGRPGRQLPPEEKQGRGHQRSQVPDQGGVGRVPGRAVPRPPGQHGKGVGKDVDREWELRSGGTRAAWRTCRNPGAPTRAADPAGGNGSHYALLRPPTA